MADEQNVFSSDPIENEETNVDLSLNDLVGEGKKYKNPDELAKAYANIERHARTLEAENAQVRAKLDIKEATNEPAEPKGPGQEQAPTGDNQQQPPNNEAPNSGKQNVDFRSQIREEVQALNEQERAKANTEAAAMRMIQVYGDAAKANEAVQRRAQELGVSVDWLRDSASRSPEAFYATMEIPRQGGSRTTPASHSDTVPRDNTGNVKNFEYFDRIRKEDPKRYFSTEVQREMMNNARTMGNDFYKR